MNEEMAHWLDIVRNSRGVPGETGPFFHMQKKHRRIFEPYLDGLVSFFLTANKFLSGEGTESTEENGYAQFALILLNFRNVLLKKTFLAKAFQFLYVHRFFSLDFKFTPLFIQRQITVTLHIGNIC